MKSGKVVYPLLTFHNLKESMMTLFIVIDLIFKKRYQVQDLPSWIPHTKIMQHLGTSCLVCLTSSIEYSG
jgi:hypothetical protein